MLPLIHRGSAVACLLLLACYSPVAFADFLGIGRFVGNTVKGAGNIASGAGAVLEGVGKTVTGSSEGTQIIGRGGKQIGQGIIEAAPAILAVIVPPLGAVVVAAPDITKYIYDTTQKWKGNPSCNPDAQIARLMTKPKQTLGDFHRISGMLSTPAKYLSSIFNGPGAWQPTGCDAVGVGTPIRDAVKSSDGFWTIDVAIIELDVNGRKAPPGRYIRLEVRPDVPAHSSIEAHLATPRESIGFAGPMVWDKDYDSDHPEGHMEVHPHDPIRFFPNVVIANSFEPAAVPTQVPPVQENVAIVSPPPLPTAYQVAAGENLSKIAEQLYGRQVWRKLYAANKELIRNPDLIFPGQSLKVPPL